ncbi:MAG: UDP-N-acetylglucosamine 2-epimerase (non-hydrolyzing) [Armatimonadetes bacterium]|nr:UDP-N-acetylglucosamine 2-epimerase (non-hydrolyzing) [Armatimonadota bacterium]
MVRALIVLGTRPEVIKLAPVYAELKRRPGTFEVEVVSTGQHRHLASQMLQVFDIPVVADLDVMQEGQPLAALTSRILTGLSDFLEQRRPDIVLVQGDTTTVFAAALAAFYHRIAIGHVEAGLRTRDKFQPFPEEINRRLTDAIADVHFAATPLARQNLLAEAISEDSIFVTGNTVADALQMVLSRQPTLANTPLEWADHWLGRVIVVTAHRRENWGVPLASICQALRRIHDAFDDVLIVIAAHPNPVVRDTLRHMLNGQQRIRIIDPPDYMLFIPLLRRSDIVLTDSGGIQEEAPSLGVPVLVLRETTERPEGVTAGAARLVGTDEDRIVAEVSRLLTSPRAYHEMATVRSPYGDGKAAVRIADALEYWFGLRDKPPEPFMPESNNGRAATDTP